MAKRRLTDEGAEELGDAKLCKYLDDIERKWSQRQKLERIRETCVVSGGADGADLQWCKAAIDQGMKVKIMSFAQHSVKVPKGAEVVVLSAEALLEADAALVEVSYRLRRKLPAQGSYNRKLLQRNWWIVKDADAVFAIGKTEEGGQALRVSGGTAWGCEMFYMKSMRKKDLSIRLFFYDMNRRIWYQAMPGDQWLQCATPSLLKFRTAALIGSRELNAQGQAAITEVFESSPVF